jgi:hypothetical protein
MLYLRTPTGLRQAIRDARWVRGAFGAGLSFVRHVAEDGAFRFSVWRGLTYLGPMGPGVLPQIDPRSIEKPKLEPCAIIAPAYNCVPSKTPRTTPRRTASR